LGLEKNTVYNPENFSPRNVKPQGAFHVFIFEEDSVFIAGRVIYRSRRRSVYGL
jgi:hypothetical protein